jgi:rod shape-determining protein MreD
MRLLLLVPILYVTAVAETSLVDLLRVGAVEPDLLALLAVVWLLLAPGPWTFLAAGAMGLVQDLLAPGRVGVGLASFLLVGYAVSRLRTQVRLEPLGLQLITVLVAVSTLAVVQALGHWLLSPAAAPLATLLPRAIGVGVYTAGVSLPVLMVAGWIRETKTRAA